MGGADLTEARGMDTQVSSTKYFPPELVHLHLLGTARHVIDLHLNDHATCADCGSPRPCQPARLAAKALAAL